VRYDATDYVLATKNSLRDLIVQEFPGAAVYMADLDVIPAFGGGGTFCLEAAASGADPGAGAFAPVVLTFRIWSYVEAVSAEAAEGALSALAQKLEAVVMAATRPAPAGDNPWLATEYLQTTYLPREKGRALRRKYLRAARTEWRVRLAAAR